VCHRCRNRRLWQLNGHFDTDAERRTSARLRCGVAFLIGLILTLGIGAGGM